MQKAPNPNGLYDVYGNVWEWVQDNYRTKLPGGKDPLVTSGPYFVVRGGSWIYHAKCLRSANRSNFPGIKSIYIGFRLVRTL